MNDPTQKIYYVYHLGEFKGYVVAANDDDAKAKAVKTLNFDPATMEVKDTGATKNKCCPRR